MKSLHLICMAALLLWGMPLAADIILLENGRKLQVIKYEVFGDSINLYLNEKSEMVVPLNWVKQIRVSPPPVKIAAAAPRGNANFDYADLVWTLSSKHELDWRLVAAVMETESNFNPRAVSPKGALGLMQLMPETAKLYQVKNPYDPRQNIEAGIKHLKMLVARYSGDLKLVLAAYNSGEKAVERYRGIPPYTETKQYVKKVLARYQGLSKI